MFGLLCRLLDDEGKIGIFIRTNIFMEWINAAKANCALQGIRRLFINRYMSN